MTVHGKNGRGLGLGMGLGNDATVRRLLKHSLGVEP